MLSATFLVGGMERQLSYIVFLPPLSLFLVFSSKTSDKNNNIFIRGVYKLSQLVGL